MSMGRHRVRNSRTLEVGMQVQRRSLQTVRGSEISIPDGTRIVHLQLRRFAGCPICNLHVRSIARRHDELVAAGILEVVVFHSTAEEMRAHSDLPFDVVADPNGGG